MILGEGLRIALVGIAMGVGVALMAGRVLAPLLFETEVTDPKVLAAVTITLHPPPFSPGWSRHSAQRGPTRTWRFANNRNRQRYG